MSQYKTKRTALNKPKLIQLIHIGKSKLCLDDETYRSLLVSMTGKDSTKQMNLSELKIILNRMGELGFISTRAKSKHTQAAGQATKAQLNLIRHLWHSLHELGAVRVNTEQAMVNYIYKQTKTALDELNTLQASMIIEQLKKWQARVESDKERQRQPQ